MSWQSDFVSGTNLNTTTKSTTTSKNLSLNLAPYNNHHLNHNHQHQTTKQLYANGNNNHNNSSYAQQQAFQHQQQQQQQQQYQNYSNSISSTTSYSKAAPPPTVVGNSSNNYSSNNVIGYSNGSTYVNSSNNNSRLNTPPSLSHRKTPTNQLGAGQQQLQQINYPLAYSAQNQQQQQQTNQYFHSSPTTSIQQQQQQPLPIQQTYYSSSSPQNSSNMGGSAQSNLQKNQPQQPPQQQPQPQPQQSQQPSPSSQQLQQQYPYTSNGAAPSAAYKNSSSSSSSIISNNYSNGQQYHGAMHQYLNHIPPGVQQTNSSQQSPLSSSRSLVLVNSIVDLIRKLGIKLIAFDFDLTLVNTHTGGQWIDSPEKLAEFVRPCFRELLPVLLKCSDLFVCIVTYSPQEELIREVLKISLKEEYGINELLNKMIIIGNTREFLEEHGVENCYSMGKQIHLDQCRKYYENILGNVYYGGQINANNGVGGFGSQSKLNNNNNNSRISNASILLIDDDVQNLKMAHSGGHLAFQVNNNMQLIDLYDFLSSQLRS